MSPKKETQKSRGFTAEEKASMKERAKELKAEASAKKDRAAGERDALAKTAQMQEPDRAMARRLPATDGHANCRPTSRHTA